MMKTRFWSLLGCIAALSLTVGCGDDDSSDSDMDDDADDDDAMMDDDDDAMMDDDSDDDDGETLIEIFSWWTAEGEAEALDALISAHTDDHPDVEFVNIAVQNVGQDPAQALNERMGLDENGEADDSIEYNPPGLMQWDLYNVSTWTDQGIEFLSLDEVYEDEGWKGKLYDFLESDIEIGGEILSLPVGLHRENGMFFNREILSDNDIEEDSLTDWDGLMAACEILKEAEVTCISLTQEDWVNMILFRTVAAMTMGPANFETYFGLEGEADDEDIAEVVANYQLLLESGYVGGWDNENEEPTKAWGWENVRTEGWDEAAKDVHRGEAAFYAHGDWAVGVYKSLGWSSEDFGVIAAPGTEDLFVYGADGFLAPQGGDNTEAVMDVVRTWGSPETLAAFNKAKGSTPPRPDVDLDDDAVAAAVADDLKNATHVMRVPGWSDGFLGELLEFAAGDIPAEDLVAKIQEVHGEQ